MSHTPLLPSIMFALALLSTPALVARGQSVQPAASVQLYDAALNSTPDQQGLLFVTYPFSGAAASQTLVAGATLLDSTPAMSEFAGYTGRAMLMPALERGIGFSVFVRARVLQEQHTSTDRNGDGIADRAGFSVTVLSSDLNGIELGFWQDQVWAQADDRDADRNLFTHAESAAFDTTAADVSYEIRVKDDSYTLLADGVTLLNGPLRNYSSFSAPPFSQIYKTPNFLFLGDNSGNGSARARIVAVSLTTGSATETSVALPFVMRSGAG